MNIGIVTTWFERGAAYVSRQFEQVLEKDGHKVFIFARGGEKYAKGDPVWDNPNVTWATRVDYLSLMSFLKKEFTKWIKDNDISIVLFNEQRYYQPLLWCKELNVLSVAYVDYYTEETIPLFAAYDALICNTKRHFSTFEHLGNAYYIPWGTDIDVYKPTNEGLVNESVVTFFHSAGMAPVRKGTDIFIKALTKVKSRYKAVIHTQRSIIQECPDVADDIKRLTADGKLEIIEKTCPAPGLYYKGDVYVYPSILEGIGLTIAESISSGLACITTDNAPMNEFVSDVFGSVIPVDKYYCRSDGYYWPACRCNIDALAGILDAYATNPEEVIRKKKMARRYAEENLSFKKNAKSISPMLESIKPHPISDSIKDKIYKYDSKGLKRFHNSFVKYKLYWFLKR